MANEAPVLESIYQTAPPGHSSGPGVVYEWLTTVDHKKIVLGFRQHPVAGALKLVVV